MKFLELGAIKKKKGRRRHGNEEGFKFDYLPRIFYLFTIFHFPPNLIGNV